MQRIGVLEAAEMTAASPVDVFLPAGQFYFGHGRVRVKTLLGTCVAITLWNPATQSGGMCHYLLPTRGRAQATADAAPGFYADEVMGMFADELRAAGTSANSYVVKIFGGGNMFPDHLSDPDCRNQSCDDARRAKCPSVGCQNIRVAHELLQSRGFSIALEDVGGHGSRQLMFDVWSGDVWVRQGRAMAAINGAS
jgi:chemotaxis protein CheD